MKRTLLKTTALAACLTVVTAPSYAFDLFGWFKKDNSIDAMIEHVPADTAFFFGGISDPEYLESADQMIQSIDYSEMSSGLTELFEVLPESKGLDILSWMLDDYYATLPEGTEKLYAHYGLDTKGASVLYMDGLYPVMRVAVKDEDAFLNLLKAGAKAVDLELGTATIDGNSLTTIELVNEDNATIHLGILVKDKVLTLSALSNKDNDAAKAQRFALAKPAMAMNPDLWDEDGETYEFNEYFRGYVSLLNIAKSLLNEDSQAIQQILAFAGDDAPDFSALQGQCKGDVLNMVAGTPRFVIGLNDYQLDDSTMTSEFSYALEVKNESILGELQKLRGFNPGYITNNDALAFGISLGISADALSPVLTSLWTQFTQAEFSCEQLQEMQAQASGFNPAMIAMFTGMAQGLSGISAGVFDVMLDESLPAGGRFDMIASVTAEKPEVLAALISNYLPMLQGTQIPTDGTPVNLADNGLPMDIFLAIKGKHLVAYSGEQGTKVANAMANEPNTANGTAALALDYQKTADVLLTAIGPWSAYSQDESCTEFYSAALMLKSFPARLTGRDDITANGFEANWTMSMSDIQSIMNRYGNNISGEYALEYLDYDCSWVAIGTETLNDDGTGMYSEQDESGSCNLYESRYQWNNAMGIMVQSESVNQYRDSCDEEWYEDEPYDFTCQVLANDDTGFYCLESGEDEPTLHRYTRQ